MTLARCDRFSGRGRLPTRLKAGPGVNIHTSIIYEQTDGDAVPTGSKTKEYLAAKAPRPVQDWLVQRLESIDWAPHPDDADQGGAP
jgi:hypothetical protein